VPWAEERGRGLFVCRSCGGTWTSNRACRSLGQWCVHEGCAAAAAAAGSGTENGQIPGELPTEIRPVEPAWHRNRRMGGGGGRQPRHQEEDGPALPSVDEQRPFTGDGGVFTEDIKRQDPAHTHSTRGRGEDTHAEGRWWFVHR
jgi:hypothetical protein